MLIQCCFNSGCKLAQRAQGEKDFVVLRIFAAAEHRFDRHNRPYDGEQLAFNVDLFPEGIFCYRTIHPRFRTQQHYGRSVLFIHFAEPAASCDLQVKDILGRGLISFKDRVFRFVIAVLHREGIPHPVPAGNIAHPP